MRIAKFILSLPLVIIGLAVGAVMLTVATAWTLAGNPWIRKERMETNGKV